ncbi:MAG: 30S ribosomal protein S16 [Fimbriimonadaceae bacterium]
MVKIRLRRIGTKARPFYRVVVASDKAGRNGRFVEIIGLYNPVTKPKVLKIDEERALYWLRLGAQPSETTAILLNKEGILEKFLAERPAKRKDYKFLDKRTAATSVASVMDTKAAEPKATAEPEPAPVAAPEPEPEAAVEEVVAEAVVEEPVAEAAPVVEPVAEEAAAEEAPAEEAEKSE